MEAEVNVVTGAGSQTGGLSRWGDYSSALTVDPVDDVLSGSQPST